MYNFNDVNDLSRSRQDFYPGQVYNKSAMLELIEWITPDHDHILDLGCGDGEMLKLIKERYPYFDVCGITARKDEMEKASSSGFKVYVGDMHSLLLENNSFDLVIARHVFEHSVAPLLALFEVNRVLREGGELIVVVPGEGSEWVIKWQDHFSVLTHAGWEKLFLDAGFSIIREEYGKWLASYSMCEEVEYRFLLRKTSKPLIDEKEMINTNKTINGENLSESTIDINNHSLLTADKPLAYVIHNLVLFETIKPLLISSPVEYDLVVPEFPDPIWQRMSEDTFSFLQEHGYNPIWLKELSNREYIVTISANLYCDMPSSRYHVRILYGMAKENWNFGIWNLNYDLILCYGPYDSQYFRSFAPTVEIGPIKFANFIKPKYREKSEPYKLLYLPTYGKECSIEQLSSILSSITCKFDITTKLHHGTSFLETERVKLASTFGKVLDHRYPLSDLLSETDVVLSDGSGAIFDAIVADVPVVVFQPIHPKRFEGKMSLEQKVIVDGIIPATDNPNKLEDLLLTVLKPDNIRDRSQLELKKKLFTVIGKESVERAWSSITPLLSSKLNDGELLSRRYLRRNFNDLKKKIFALEQGQSQNRAVWSEQRQMLLKDIKEMRLENDDMIKHNETLTNNLQAYENQVLHFTEQINQMQNTISQKEGEIIHLQSHLASTESELQAHEGEIIHLQSHLASTESELQAHEGEIIHLQSHLASTESELQAVYSSRRYYIANKMAIILWYLKHPRFLFTKMKIKMFLLMRKKLPAPTKQWIKRVILHQAPQPWQPPQRLSLLEESLIKTPIKLRSLVKYDIIVFSIIDWDFRFQRPQQMASIFAKHGHRVFYLSTRFDNNLSSPIVKEVIENVFVVQLPGSGNLNIYRDTIKMDTLVGFYNAIIEIQREYKLLDAVCLTQLPFWLPLVLKLKKENGWKIIYDCMDRHSGFSTNDVKMLSEEEKLVRESDLVVITARQLYDEQKVYNDNCIVISNAADFKHFNSYIGKQPQIISALPKPIIGYYGAISDWFDVSIVEYLAINKSDWQFVLIGSTFGADVSSLTSLSNVHILGELPYSELPGYLQGFDVCMIPFKINPLTEATNPVKFYEYLSAGKPVVATPLPELIPYRSLGLIYLAQNGKEFLEAIEQALAENLPDVIYKRIKFSRENTWDLRVCEMDEAIKKLFKLASIIIITYNNLHLTEQCVNSIYKNTVYPNFELIIVDNASTDETQDYLKRLAEEKNNVKIILNEDNKGFAGGNNQGIKISGGEYIVLLNNDTIVTSGWLSKLINMVEQDKAIGMIGPVTNSAGNEAQIEVSYTSLEEMEWFAENYTTRFESNHIQVDMLAMFCVVARRAVIDEVGFLDERFGVGMFEDDDYAMRIKEKGYNIILSHEVFIHHFGKSSFKQFPERDYIKLFEENRKKFEKKWNKRWEPPQLRNAVLSEEERKWVLEKELEWIIKTHEDVKGIIIYPPTIDWAETLFQRPQQLALAFAKLGYLFFYCVCNPEVDNVFGFKEIDINIYLCYAPLEIFRIIKSPVVWISRPDNLDKLIYFNEPFLIYDYIDELEVFHTYGPQVINNHEKLINIADLCLATADKLVNEIAIIRSDVLLCPNAGDFNFFAKAQSKEGHKIPEDFETIVSKGKPIIGYYGALAKWFDYELVEYAAINRKEYKYVLIGPDYDQTIRKSGILKLDNVIWLGPKKYRDLPDYLRYFDVGTIPFKINNITMSTNPIKLFEYMSAGKPVVTTAMPECKKYPEVLASESPEDFVLNLDKALSLKNDQDYVAKLIEVGKNNSWDTRAQDIASHLQY